MTENSSVRDDRQKEPENKSRIQYVQELANADDVWITVPHAARITGASESMANRWVSSGRLPIRGNPETRQEELLGIPPRTRSCRLSDVRAIRPILYPDLVTGSAIRTLDLPSIPQAVARITAAQEQINQDHQQLKEQQTTLQDAVDNNMAQLRQETQQQQEELRRQLREVCELLATQLQETVAWLKGVLPTISAQFTAQQEELQTLHDKLQQADISHKATLNDLRNVVNQQYTDLRVELITAGETTRREQQATTNHIQTLLEKLELAQTQQQAQFTQALHLHQQQVAEQLRQIADKNAQRQRDLEQRITKEATQYNEQFVKLSTQAQEFARQCDGSFQEIHQQQEELAGQVNTVSHRTDTLAQSIPQQQDAHRSRLDVLEQIVAEQGKQLMHYEHLLSLPSQLDSLYHELTARGLITN